MRNYDWWRKMYRIRFALVVGIACFCFIILDISYRIQYVPICIGLVLTAYLISSKF